MTPRFQVRYVPIATEGDCESCGLPAERLVIVDGKSAQVIVCGGAWCAAQALARFPLKTAVPYEG